MGRAEMNMREALAPDECDKMNHFFGWLLTIDSAKEPGHKVDLNKALWEYRKTYGNPRPSDKLIKSLAEKNKRKSCEGEKHRETLEKYRALPIGAVAIICGVPERTVQGWYQRMGIIRPINYNGHKGKVQ